jgi:hypothetical protein
VHPHRRTPSAAASLFLYRRLLGLKNQQRGVFGEVHSAFFALSTLVLHVFARWAGKPHRSVAAHAKGDALRILRLALRTLHGRPQATTQFWARDDSRTLHFNILRESRKEGCSTKVTGGREGARTLGLSVANAALSQLSYAPTLLLHKKYNTAVGRPPSFTHGLRANSSRQTSGLLPVDPPARRRPGRNPGLRRPCPQTLSGFAS